MLQTRNRRRLKRISLAQVAREIGPRAQRAFRRARVALWLFKRSPEQQDRASMIATFAFIGIFTLGSVDAIVTGGADFGVASAYASEMPAATRIVPQQATTPAAAVEEADPAKAGEDENVDYSFTTEDLLGGPLLAVNDEAPIDALVIEANKLLEVLEPAAAIENDNNIL